MKNTLKLIGLLFVLCFSLSLLVACNIAPGIQNQSARDTSQKIPTKEDYVVTGAYFNDQMHLILSFSNGYSIDLGQSAVKLDENLHLIVALPGDVSVDMGKVNVKLDENLHLIVTLPGGSNADIGKVEANVNEELHLMLTLPDGTVVDGGEVDIDLPSTTLAYTVTFQDHDGTVLKTETVEIGKNATPPADPTRKGYRFTGWDKEYTSILSDVTLTAQYAKQVTVTFKDYDGTVLNTQSVDSGTGATAPKTPTRAGYIFNGWDKAFSRVTEDTVVTAIYLEEVKVPTIQVQEVIAKAGATKVAVQISLRKNPGISSMLLNLSYDTSALTLTGYTFNSALGGQTVPFDPSVDSSSLAWTNFCASNVKGDLVYATLYFTVKSGASAGMHDITVTYDGNNVFDMNESNVHFDVIAGGIEVRK